MIDKAVGDSEETTRTITKPVGSNRRGADNQGCEARSVPRALRGRRLAARAMGDKVKQTVEEVLRHIAAAEGAENVEIVVDLRAENAVGFSESVARTVNENSRVLGFDVSEFEDAEW